MNADEDVEKGERLHTANRNQYSHHETLHGAPPKIKTEMPLLGVHPKRVELVCQIHTATSMIISISFTIAKEPTVHQQINAPLLYYRKTVQ